MGEIRRRLALFLLRQLSLLLRRLGHVWTAKERQLYAEALGMLSENKS